LKAASARNFSRYASTFASNSLISSVMRAVSCSIAGLIDLRSCGVFFLAAVHLQRDASS
jgi:hypothetical protein